MITFLSMQGIIYETLTVYFWATLLSAGFSLPGSILLKKPKGIHLDVQCTLICIASIHLQLADGTCWEDRKGGGGRVDGGGKEGHFMIIR